MVTACLKLDPAVELAEAVLALRIGDRISAGRDGSERPGVRRGVRRPLRGSYITVSGSSLKLLSWRDVVPLGAWPAAMVMDDAENRSHIGMNG
jgi:hypothetical protein